MRRKMSGRMSLSTDFPFNLYDRKENSSRPKGAEKMSPAYFSFTSSADNTHSKAHLAAGMPSLSTMRR